MKKWKSRSVGTDLIVKGILGIIVFIMLLLGFNYCISGTIYAADFWTMISGVVTTLAAFIALIVFSRRAIVENLYLSTWDAVMATFYRDIEKDVKLSEKYFELEKQYGDDTDGFFKSIEPMQRTYLINCFKDYIDNLNILERLVINLYSLFTVGKFSSHLEVMRAIYRDWFTEGNPDF